MGSEMCIRGSYSTHDLTVLGNHPSAVVPHSQVWFVEKHDGASELVALDEYQLRPGNNLERKYLQGAFDARPAVSVEALASAVRKILELKVKEGE